VPSAANKEGSNASSAEVDFGNDTSGAVYHFGKRPFAEVIRQPLVADKTIFTLCSFCLRCSATTRRDNGKVMLLDLVQGHLEATKLQGQASGHGERTETKPPRQKQTGIQVLQGG
jgi:hypothetical protein